MTPQLLGHRVLLLPLDLSLQKTKSGVLVPDTYQRPNIHFKVGGVGPGRWLYRKGKSPKWISPEVKFGDVVLSTHWQNDRTHWGWHKTEHDQRQTQEGLVIVDARHIVAILEFGPSEGMTKG